MPLTNNKLGQMYALTVFTPIITERLAELRAFLDGLPAQSSPLQRLGMVHFAPWVVVPDFVSDRSQPRPEHLPSPYLLFSATFDGSLDAFFDDLCDKLATEAETIWACCKGAPVPTRGAPLQEYLKHNQIATGLFYAAYPNASVTTVKRALDVREKAIAFAARGQGMELGALREAFLQEFAP
jgi:hypothetical protein